jgi:hypothetical protein
VTSIAADAHVVAAVAKAILTHIAEPRAAQPVLAGLKAKELMQGLGAPRIRPLAGSTESSGCSSSTHRGHAAGTQAR